MHRLEARLTAIVRGGEIAVGAKRAAAEQTLRRVAGRRAEFARAEQLAGVKSVDKNLAAFVKEKGYALPAPLRLAVPMASSSFERTFERHSALDPVDE